MTSVFEDQKLLVFYSGCYLIMSILETLYNIDDEIVLSLPRLSQLMSLQKINLVIVIADLLLTWQHLTMQ